MTHFCLDTVDVVRSSFDAGFVRWCNNLKGSWLTALDTIAPDNAAICVAEADAYLLNDNNLNFNCSKLTVIRCRSTDAELPQLQLAAGARPADLAIAPAAAPNVS